MFRKILTIAQTRLQVVYTDRNRILMMLVTPLALSTLIAAAFGDVLGNANNAPVQDIPIAVVNLDAGALTGDTEVNNGQIIVDLLVPATNDDEASALFTLTDAVELDNTESARAAVDRGEYVAAIIIPADFSANLTVTRDDLTLQPTQIEVYASPASPIAAGIIRTITERISTQIATGNVTVAATINALVAQAQTDPALALELGLSRTTGSSRFDFTGAFGSQTLLIDIDQQTVSGETATFNPLVYFGSGLAIFFTLFATLTGTTDFLNEQRNGTLQRLITTPTPIMAILLGKLIGVFVVAVVQVTVLFLALTIVGSLISGELQLIWGSNIPAVALVIVAAALAASGLAALIAALAQTSNQANLVGNGIIMAMGVFGGTFFPIEGIGFIETLSRFTIVYWGTNAFTRLSQGSLAIGSHILVLFGFGTLLFVIGLLVFRQRFKM